MRPLGRTAKTTEQRTRGRRPAAVVEEQDEIACLLGGTYLDDVDSDEDGDGRLDTQGCLPRLRLWTAGLLHPRRHSARGWSWVGSDESRYNPLF